MHLARLEIHGFKTFAQKTVFPFLYAKNGCGFTAIVGPNGSGKSNAADALRWVMGEQSPRLLRTKSSEDVIFAGSASRARSGFAEVRLVFEKGEGEHREELSIARRYDRDGQSSYEINNEPARLTDVSLLLVNMGIAQRSYTVIGQGMVDHVLSATPHERRLFFDEAFGVRPLFLRREQAVRRLDEAARHLEQARAVMAELEPRVASLQKQIDRLNQRETWERERRELEEQWYGSQWKLLGREAERLEGEQRALQTTQERLDHLREEVSEAVQEPSASIPSQQHEQDVQERLQQVREQLFALRDARNKQETMLAVARVQRERPWSPLPLSKIIERLTQLEREMSLLQASAPSLEGRELTVRLRVFTEALRGLLGELERPAPEQGAQQEEGRIQMAIRELMQQEEALQQVMQDLERSIERARAQERQAYEAARLQDQRRVERERERFSLEQKRSELRVQLARIEERRANLLTEITERCPWVQEHLDAFAQRASDAVDPAMSQRLHRLRSQLEWVGSIPPETQAEYDVAHTRFVELQTQTQDIQKSLEDLHTLTQELDVTIQEKRQSAFTLLNEAFQSAAQEIFNGGEARLVEVRSEREIDAETGEYIDGSEQFEGIDILATPPGKRLKPVSLLSGGERALVSIALLCAIMQTNPSPFVVLDEVDAALDEANARRFGEVLARLSKQTQVIVITHNRATMVHADTVYGISMTQEGVSSMLSLRLEQGETSRPNEQ